MGRRLALGVFMMCAAACGGTTTTGTTRSDGGTAGVGGASGVSGASGVGGAGGAGGSSGSGGICAEGAACPSSGLICTPDECCPCSYRCENGVWRIASCPSCVAPSCPFTAPVQGSLCNACDKMLTTACTYGVCPGQNLFVMKCDGTSWIGTTVSCPAAQPCGYDPSAVPCAPGYLCVYPGGLGDLPHCAPNPCPMGTSVSCDCAGQLCTYGYCSNADSTRVDCVCPNC